MEALPRSRHFVGRFIRSWPSSGGSFLSGSLPILTPRTSWIHARGPGKPHRYSRLAAFGSFRSPRNSSELPPEDAPRLGEDPFFCLLEDDALVTRIGITTDRLLEPLEPGDPSDVSFIVLHVVTKATRVTFNNIGLSG